MVKLTHQFTNQSGFTVTAKVTYSSAGVDVILYTPQGTQEMKIDPTEAKAFWMLLNPEAVTPAMNQNRFFPKPKE